MEHPRSLVARLPPALVIPLLLAAAAGWIRFARPEPAVAEARLRPDLPDRVGAWTGVPILYCQHEPCGMVLLPDESPPPTNCPTCGESLAPMAPAERRILPPDTRIVRRQYRAPFEPAYTVTVVQSGADHRSIHRPQECLPGQGVRIERERRHTLPLAQGPFPVVILDARSEQQAAIRFGFAYWFVGPDRATPSYFARHLWPTLDRLLRNKASRWAYVAVLASEPLDTPESIRRLSVFLDQLMPALEPPAHPPL